MNGQDIMPAMETLLAARGALVELAAGQAVERLENSLWHLRELAARLERGPGPASAERDSLRNQLQRFRAELQAAGALAASGEAACRDCAGDGEARPAYRADGSSARGTITASEFSVQA